MKAKPLTISQALKEGSDFLGTEIDNAYHEALILLQHATHRTKEYLIAHTEETIREDCLSRFRQYLERRDHGEPIAYIIEEKEFWSLPFYVTQGVLIPRPETEQLVESTLELFKNRSHAKILDLGTGCGCIALSIAKEKPDTQVTACDISDACLNVAQVNAQNLNIHNVSFVRSHWFSAITPGDFDIIVCNPPYISEDDQLIEEALETVDEVFPWDLEEWIADKKNMLLLDVRESYGFDAMKIRDSINVPRGILETACEYNYDATVPELASARDRKVVVICRSGKRSVLAAQTMQRMGYKDVLSLKLGVKGWNDTDLPLYDKEGELIDADYAEEFLVPELRPEQIRT